MTTSVAQLKFVYREIVLSKNVSQFALHWVKFIHQIHQICIPETGYYQKVSSHAQI